MEIEITLFSSIIDVSCIICEICIFVCLDVGVMNATRVHLVLLTLILPVLGGPSPMSSTYWVDETCDTADRKSIINDALADALEWARRAAERMKSSKKEDEIQKKYFELLFAPRNDPEYSQKVQFVESELLPTHSQCCKSS